MKTPNSKIIYKYGSSTAQDMVGWWTIDRSSGSDAILIHQVKPSYVTNNFCDFWYTSNWHTSNKLKEWNNKTIPDTWEDWCKNYPEYMI